MTPTSSILLVLVSSFFGSFGAVFLKLGAEHMKGSIFRVLTNYWLATGVVFYLMSSVFYMMGVSQGQLTVLYPMVSLGYIWAMIWAWIFFKERFTMAKVGGLMLIIVGVSLISFGNA
ncbi:MAG TPA: EamA family transporter [Bryobacteraceae bacterium]|jgi:undecaprenyl phosphate-alpha-L-ara4N flippase subunit ArnE|nr:EamA family transporter [Bryobacteraceae bacterium]